MEPSSSRAHNDDAVRQAMVKYLHRADNSIVRDHLDDNL